MKTKQLPAANVQDWLARLTDKQKQVSLFTGNGTGWGTTLAWNPAAQWTYRRGQHTLQDAAVFVQTQTAAGRKVWGFVSYDLGYELHNIPQTAKDDLHIPDVYLLAYDNYLEFAPQHVSVHYKNEAFLREVLQLQDKKPKPYTGAFLEKPFEAVMNRQAYDNAYQKVKQYILDGDVYQVNLTHRLQSQTKASPRQLFARLAARASTAFLAYVEGPDFAVHSVSPERFVQIKDRRIETFPIKGTRPRGKNAKQDQALRRELLDSPKDAAELNMITDLLRNDLGKVSQTGSVKVVKKRQILQTPTVFHTYSHIRGKLRPDVQPIQAVLSMAPGGSITGCPKKRAMEIIDELEPFTRSVYCGSMLAIDPNGQLDSNIAIRTLIQKGSRLVLQVGGGIVHHSVNDAEYQETWDKAQGIIRALNS